jgi:alpha-1,3-rhamnosyl/mannosyltransferase
MIRLSIDTGNAPDRTGIGVFANGLLAALANYAAGRITASKSDTSSTSRSWRPVHRLIYLARLRKAYTRSYDGADLVHFTNTYVPKRHPRVCYASTVHDLDAILFPETYPASYRMYIRKIVPMALRRADLILTPSNAVRQAIIARFGVDAETVRAVHHGLAPDFVRLVDTTAVEENSGIPTLLFVGMLWKKKNIAWLISRIAAGVRSNALPKLRLILAGSAGFRFDDIASELRNASGVVSWIQSPSLPDLVKLYLQSSVVVLPSITEGYGLPLVEAMYCRKPIVASRIPSSVEVAEDAAWYFGLDDDDGFYHAVNEALADRDRARRLEGIHTRMRGFFWETLIPQFVGAYEHALERRTGKRVTVHSNDLKVAPPMNEESA